MESIPFILKPFKTIRAIFNIRLCPLQCNFFVEILFKPFSSTWRRSYKTEILEGFFFILVYMKEMENLVHIIVACSSIENFWSRIISRPVIPRHYFWTFQFLSATTGFVSTENVGNNLRCNLRVDSFHFKFCSNEFIGQ